ncbi:MAG: deoxyribonuclease V [Gammaproteobacteria bacterium]|nr:deoxyribonuclease V [Gammaproteobacteria bacterium]
MSIPLHHAHPWQVTAKEAFEIQHRLALEVRLEDEIKPDQLHNVAGVDVGFEEAGSITRAAVAVLAFPSLELIEYSIARVPTSFPYVPGLLSFRELPAVLQALEGLSRLPELFLCDGQGIAHPRRLGIAAHLGVLTDIPSIGVAKTRLTGRYEEPDREKGDWSPLLDGKERIGTVLRTRTGIKPLYISPGHRVGHPGSIELTLACTGRYKLPETTRWAHRLASDKRYRQSQ